MKKIFIAYNRELETHCLFEVVTAPVESYHNEVYSNDVCNQLAHWQDLSELIKVLEITGPLIYNDIVKGMTRSVSILDLKKGLADSKGNILLKDYQECDIESLFDWQLYFDGAKVKENKKHKKLVEVLEKHDLFAPGNAKEISKWANKYPEAEVVIEPITDLVFARNYASVLMRLIGNYSRHQRDPFLASGFTKVSNSYQIKLMSDFQKPYVSDDWIRNLAKYRIPLLNSVFAMPTTRSIICYQCEERSIDLLIDAGPDPNKVLSEFILGTAETVCNLTDIDGNSIGWQYLLPGPEYFEIEKIVVPNSLFGWLMSSILYRVGSRIDVCQNCNAGFIYVPKGKERVYCSDRCRSAYYLRKSKANE